MKKTIGIIGGMGPAATVDLYARIVEATDAATDAAHLHVIIDSNTAVPDRTAAILHGGEDPTPELIRSARRLEAAGAELLMLACNTSYYFYDRFVNAVSVPFLHMPRETAREAARRGYHRIALLATDGTRQAGVYQHAFDAAAPETRLLLPEAEDQALLMELIYDNVKAGRWDMAAERLEGMLRRLTAQGAEAFVLGCTELPIAFRYYAFPIRVIDPTTVLARAAVLAAGGRLKEEN